MGAHQPRATSPIHSAGIFRQVDVEGRGELHSTVDRGVDQNGVIQGFPSPNVVQRKYAIISPGNVLTLDALVAAQKFNQFAGDAPARLKIC